MFVHGFDGLALVLDQLDQRVELLEVVDVVVVMSLVVGISVDDVQVGLVAREVNVHLRFVSGHAAEVMGYKVVLGVKALSRDWFR